MSDKTSNQKNRNKAPSKAKPKRPPLTHFLCLPLVNSISLPQFESSLAAFKASIPSSFPAKPDQNKFQQQQHRPLIPDGAIRPVGTLHLTLGVMSLSTPERLDEALRFFNSLDLVALMRKAEESAAQKRLAAGNRKRKSLVESTQERKEEDIIALSTDKVPETASTDTLTPDESTTPQPFTISLESMHVLPRARSATVLHAVPVDPTSRLYPFCETLRNEFLKAGFLQGELKKEPEKENQDKSLPGQVQRGPNQSPPQPSTGEEPTLLEELPTTIAEETAQQSRPPVTTTPSQPPNTSRTGEPCSKSKPRPLLLHATVVNTIYIRGRKRNPNSGGPGGKNQRSSQYTFDAREILAHYRNFYVDSERTVLRGGDESRCIGNDLVFGIGEQQPGGLTADAEAGNKKGKGKEQSASTQRLPDDPEKNPGYPFVWARDFPLEALCICEMGAKKLNADADETGMNARLREKYLVVAERSLDFPRLGGVLK
ncbi:hypothetical protein BJX99DRAFT_255012 [Aspergillus californicus]